jgi:PIN domain nuclease of toxin-antitoxin system
MNNGYLLDTQAIIWYFSGSNDLDKQIADEISNPENAIFISRISFWEISIKSALGKLRLGADLESLMRQCQQAGFVIIGLENEHILTLENLPSHHRDPFDRILIAQCMAEELEIISSDAALDSYPVSRKWKG